WKSQPKRWWCAAGTRWWRWSVPFSGSSTVGWWWPITTARRSVCVQGLRSAMRWPSTWATPWPTVQPSARSAPRSSRRGEARPRARTSVLASGGHQAGHRLPARDRDRALEEAHPPCEAQPDALIDAQPEEGLRREHARTLALLRRDHHRVKGQKLPTHMN